MASAHRSLLITLLIATLVAVSFNAAKKLATRLNSHNSPTLQFNYVRNSADNTSRFSFKVLQLTDLHFGEAPDTDWGPRQDTKSEKAIRSVISSEKPDLIVLGGDQITANNIDRNASAYHEWIIEILTTEQPGIRWCTIFGNHDDQAFETWFDNGTVVYTEAKTTRQDLLMLDMSFEGSQTRASASGVFGTSNYAVPLHLGTEIVADIYFFDSGGGSIPQNMTEGQLRWFRNVSSASKHRPAIAFQHIPVNFDFRYRQEICDGFNGEGVTPLQYDPGILSALSEHGNVHFLAVGHDHGNDYCCMIDYSNTLHICFGRHSGYGGYGRWDRGARVYELMLEKEEDKSLKFSWQSWVRMENGEIANDYRVT